MRAWVTCHGSSLTRLRKAVQSQIKPSRNVPLTWMVIILWITSENLWHCKDVCLWDTLLLDEVFDQVLWTSSSLNSHWKYWGYVMDFYFTCFPILSTWMTKLSLHYLPFFGLQLAPTEIQLGWSSKFFRTVDYQWTKGNSFLPY